AKAVDQVASAKIVDTAEYLDGVRDVLRLQGLGRQRYQGRAQVRPRPRGPAPPIAVGLAPSLAIDPAHRSDRARPADRAPGGRWDTDRPQPGHPLRHPGGQLRPWIPVEPLA